jgi:glycosyltransferase involved in cell wall biosynthesis
MERSCPERVDLSFVLVAYNMERELPRTLMSLGKSYQIGASGIDYEVLVVDSGSRPPFGSERVASFGDCFRYLYLENAPPSPAYALNQGVRHSRGAIVCVMIDGARIASPGLVRWAVSAFKAFDDPTVSVLGWHIGPRPQNFSINHGYDRQTEDALLQEIGCPDNGYKLFDISVFGGSCEPGWFSPIAESNAIFLRKESYWRIGGYDERFDLAGGGLVNLDFYRRAVLRDQSELVILLGEGVFHQIHGGISTNVAEDQLKRNLQTWRAQYKQIRGEDFARPKKQPIYLGTIPENVLASIAESARKAMANRIAWELQ